MEIVTLVPIVEPLFLTVESWLVLVEVVKVNETMGSVALSTAVITVHLAATYALTATFLFPSELERFEFGTFMRTITPGLTRTLTTGAPEVGLALLHINLEAALLGNFWQH